MYLQGGGGRYAPAPTLRLVRMHTHIIVRLRASIASYGLVRRASPYGAAAHCLQLIGGELVRQSGVHRFYGFLLQRLGHYYIPT